jgi:hypothetical protein
MFLFAMAPGVLMLNAGAAMLFWFGPWPQLYTTPRV